MDPKLTLSKSVTAGKPSQYNIYKTLWLLFNRLNINRLQKTKCLTVIGKLFNIT